MSPTPAGTSTIAAIVHAERGSADRVVMAFATALKLRGKSVHGLVQQRIDGNKCSMRLVDLRTGTEYPLYQNLGSGSESCSLDSSKLASASVVLRRALADRADLVIANRFGGLEASGKGMAAEMLALMAADIPFLTVVSDDYLPAWRYFTGDMALELPAQKAALDTWFDGLDR